MCIELNYNSFQDLRDEEAKEYGRGNRVKKQVTYDDDINDAQWFKNFEEAVTAMIDYLAILILGISRQERAKIRSQAASHRYQRRNLRLNRRKPMKE